MVSNITHDAVGFSPRFIFYLKTVMRRCFSPFACPALSTLCLNTVSFRCFDFDVSFIHQRHRPRYFIAHPLAEPSLHCNPTSLHWSPIFAPKSPLCLMWHDSDTQPLTSHTNKENIATTNKLSPESLITSEIFQSKLRMWFRVEFSFKRHEYRVRHHGASS